MSFQGLRLQYNAGSAFRSRHYYHAAEATNPALAVGRVLLANIEMSCPVHLLIFSRDVRHAIFE